MIWLLEKIWYNLEPTKMADVRTITRYFNDLTTWVNHQRISVGRAPYRAALLLGIRITLELRRKPTSPTLDRWYDEHVAPTVSRDAPAHHVIIDLNGNDNSYPLSIFAGQRVAYKTLIEVCGDIPYAKWGPQVSKNLNRIPQCVDVTIKP